ncbi:MAG TPA: hypothetical protein PKO41_02480 [Dokdonella sp.]|uniref:hypothetical protein n=1 Tax=Dokdonella sp. TaxID=2291710 RepID=UPI0025BAD220|nr:hypothetical protein [Dokdonella sp.]MBX3690998.1 hypothetical protein [Dokdonella sp.]HNR91269.1 hypothetical protein [Dokdonella sp.]
MGPALGMLGCAGVAIAVAVFVGIGANAGKVPVKAGAKAEGKFAAAGGAFDVVGAYAWEDGVGIFNNPGIRVAIANAPLDAAAIDAAPDRTKAIRQTGVPGFRVAFLMFAKDGSWEGYSGNGCGYCFQRSVKSTVKVRKGRIAGDVKYAGDAEDLQMSPPFELRFDAPVVPARP